MIPFEPATSQFSIVNAYFLASASRLAYATDPASSPIAADLGLTDIHNFADTDDNGPDWGVRCFMARYHDVDIVAFRGTSDLPGWMTDADIRQVGDVGGAVHEGFHDGLMSVWPRLVAALLESQRPLWITGHSLGGALATLAGRWLAARNYPIAGIYTLGSPRVGNRAFAAGYEPRLFRLVNNDDVIPHVPLELTLAGLRLVTYKHVGTLKYFDRHGQLDAGTSNWETKKRQMLDTLRDVAGAIDLGRHFTDHYIDNYVAAIAGNLPAATAAAA